MGIIKNTDTVEIRISKIAYPYVYEIYKGMFPENLTINSNFHD